MASEFDIPIGSPRLLRRGADADLTMSGQFGPALRRRLAAWSNLDLSPRKLASVYKAIWTGPASPRDSHRTHTLCRRDAFNGGVSYAITSVSRELASAEELRQFNRELWGIENRLHWVRDVTFGEDKCRSGTLPENSHPPTSHRP